MTTKPNNKMTAEEIVNLIISNTASQYSEEWKPDVVYTKEELIKIVESYAQSLLKKKLKEQREICAEAYLTAYESEDEADAIRNAPEPKI